MNTVPQILPNSSQTVNISDPAASALAAAEAELHAAGLDADTERDVRLDLLRALDQPSLIGQLCGLRVVLQVALGARNGSVQS